MRAFNKKRKPEHSTKPKYVKMMIIFLIKNMF